MFSGIVEEAGTVTAVTRKGGNVDLRIKCTFARELHPDQSVAHNGVCLTVVELHGDDTYTVTAIDETLKRSNLGDLKPGSRINLERCIKIDDRLDGHIVQGHVDTTATLTRIEEFDGSRKLFFEYDVDPELERRGYVTVEKGSVTVNGVSLTVCDAVGKSFAVALIPYTLDITNLGDLRPGDRANIEFDIIGKYIARLIPGNNQK